MGSVPGSFTACPSLVAPGSLPASTASRRGLGMSLGQSQGAVRKNAGAGGDGRGGSAPILDRVGEAPPGDRMPQPDPSRLAFDDVVIDFVGRRLVRAGSEQPLEPKAFAVLALLAGSPGRVFTRDELLD